MNDPFNYLEQYPNGYTLKDWEKGEKVDFDILEKLQLLDYDVYDNNGNLIKVGEFTKIKKAQEKIYWFFVKQGVELEKELLVFNYDQSIDKKIFIENTFKRYEWMLDLDQTRSEEYSFIDWRFGHNYLSTIRRFAQEYIVDGKPRDLKKVQYEALPVFNINKPVYSSAGDDFELLCMTDLDITCKLQQWVKTYWSL